MKKKLTEETTPEVEIPVKISPELSESEQIVEGNKELEQIKKDIIDGRAEHVRQTDARLAKIKELDDILTSKTNQVRDANTLINITLPQKQAELAETINKTNVVRSQIETSIADIAKREDKLAKATAELTKQKLALDAQASAQELRAISLDEREKNLNTAAKEIIAFKNAMGKI